MYEFDRPFFKQLAATDTGKAKSHVAGVLINKDLVRYFPKLKTTPTATNPSEHVLIRADLFSGSTYLETVYTNYQYQSRSAERKPETRITSNLYNIQSISSAGDYLVFEQSLEDEFYYRITLCKKDTKEYHYLKNRAGIRKFGPVDIQNPPAGETEVQSSTEAQLSRELLPFSMFDDAAAFSESHYKRVARSKAFSRRVLPLYDSICAVCGKSHVGKGGAWEAEAAHIVPRRLLGADDARNGIALCRSHHWAFDQGLFGIQADHRIHIESTVASEPRNSHLLPFSNQKIRIANDLAFQADPATFAWHMANVVYST